MFSFVGDGLALIGAPPSTGGSAGPSAIYSLTDAGIPTDGVTGVGVVPNSGLYYDSSNNNLYLNIGTLALPVYSGLIRT